ncbi:MAG: hypothetical protein KDD45_04380 [Bdellovibrionales bacterium]|nr:hypothetical protein [Bdellovibrionales bacterium]
MANKKSTPCLSMLTLCASNVKNLILEVEKIVSLPWLKPTMQLALSSLKNLYVLAVVIFLLQIAPNMGKISYSLSVNFAVVLPSGFVGEILISVILVIGNNAAEIM